MEPLLAFQRALRKNIPLVAQMELSIQQCDAHQLVATAPLKPNINDKGTVFGGSSSALMTICGWALLKHNLEQLGLNNDVVIYQAQTQWQHPQSDELLITVAMDETLDWPQIVHRVGHKRRSMRLPLTSTVSNSDQRVCTQMGATYVILK